MVSIPHTAGSVLNRKLTVRPVRFVSPTVSGLRGAGEGFERFGVGEAGPVIADLAEDAGS